jgi:prepilin-type N-terminal cleavage/methylation domain-containing protein
MKTQTHNQKGFTLVETLVSLGIFVIVMTAAVSSLVVVNNAALRAQQMRTLLDNITFAMDSMVRTVRTAEAVSCGNTPVLKDCPSGSGKKGASLYVKSTLGQQEDIVYRLQNGTIQKQIGNSANWLDMTSTEITISKLDFYVTGAEDSGTTQPLVRIFISGVATTKGGQISPFAFQTAVTPRAPGL